MPNTTGVLQICDKKVEHFCMVLDGCGEAGYIRDISPGDRAAIDDVDLAVGYES